MSLRLFKRAALAAAAAAAMGFAAPAVAQVSVASGVGAGSLEVPVNKSQVLRSDRPFSKALIGNPDIADIVPISPTAVYVLGKKSGTTSLTLYDRTNRLIAVVDIVVGPDVLTLKHQLSDLLPGDIVAVRMSNDSVVLDGMVRNAVDADRAVQIAETYAPGKVVNLLSLASAQQVMLEVRFAEVNRSALQQLGLNWNIMGGADEVHGVIGGGSSTRPIIDPTTGAVSGTQILNGTITDSFAIISRTFRAFGDLFNVQLDALEKKGAITTLAEPTLIALSGETASFLAGGEFPVPVVQNVGSGGGNSGTSAAYTVEWKPFGVSLAFTPTVLADGVINMVVAPEVSSIDPSASVVINGLSIPGLQTRRARTVIEIRDGESFAMAGLIRRDFQDTIRQVPILGSIPIIGALFRSTGFQHNESELIIIVTPHLVRPVPAGTLKLPTDTAGPPNETDLLINGRTDTGVPQAASPFNPPPLPPPGPARPAGGGGMAQKQPLGFEKDYGHVL
jgi:pilus assembly protein CpaC